MDMKIISNCYLTTITKTKKQNCEAEDIRTALAPTFPSEGMASAIASVVVPVNIPTSSTVFAPVRRHNVAISLPSKAPAQHSFFCKN